MIGLTSERIAEELQSFSAKLAQGGRTLHGLGEIETGVSPREAVYQEDKLTLYRYRPRLEKPHSVPLLIVYALVNRPYMMDLQEDRSMIRGLLDARTSSGSRCCRRVVHRGTIRLKLHSVVRLFLTIPLRRG